MCCGGSLTGDLYVARLEPEFWAFSSFAREWGLVRPWPGMSAEEQQAAAPSPRDGLHREGLSIAERIGRMREEAYRKSGAGRLAAKLGDQS
jgi:hypothetical protein